MNPRAAVLVLLIAAGCAPKLEARSGAEVAEPPLSGEEAPGRDDDEPIIALAELTLTQEGRPIARLHADGRSEGTEPDRSGKPAVFVPGPTFRADGVVTFTRGGFTARVERGGDIYVVSPPGHPQGEQLFGRIVGDELQGPDSKAPWIARVEGNTLRFNGPGLPNTIEGAVDDQARRTVLIMTAAFFIDLAITGR